MNDATVNRLNATNNWSAQNAAINAQLPTAEPAIAGMGFLDDCTTFPWAKQPQPQLEKAATDTLKKLDTVHTEYGRTKVLDRFVATLNEHTAVQMSYPAKPMYTYSSQELHTLKNYLGTMKNKAEVAGQLDRAGNLAAMMDAVDAALEERKNGTPFVPPVPLPLFPKDELPFIHE